MYNKAISKKLTQIMELCYQINYEETNREKTGNLPTVFLDFMGHTCQINVRIYDDGWANRDYPDFSARISLDGCPDDVSTELSKLIERLGVTLKLKERKERKRNV